MPPSALTVDYTGSSIFIYDLQGNHLITTTVIFHDRTEKQIRVSVMPSNLNVNDECKLFILTSPAPCEYYGKIKKFGGSYTIAMFQGQVKENRAAVRYKVNSPAIISTYISDGQEYDLLNPITVRLINISTSGVRFRAPFHSLSEGDTFLISMTISGSEKSLVAQVVNRLDNKSEHTDYGCSFIQ